ncbi:MAG TPA: antitoxin Xre-like helix-turn-helix domain-containing protein [Terracidiphilus sp.]|nr:antitoxin Xre-like helix-turn-helix domain-containing protein [Terracidiphilus sp.]
MAAAIQVPLVAGYDFEAAPNLADSATRKRLSPAAIKGFFRLAARWQVKDEDARQLLGGISSGSFYALKKNSRALDQDTLTRISLLVGIFKDLHILYSQRLADRWIQLPNSNPMFHGGTPLAYMLRLGLPGMMHLRQLLDARRGGQ